MYTDSSLKRPHKTLQKDCVQMFNVIIRQFMIHGQYLYMYMIEQQQGDPLTAVPYGIYVSSS